MEPVWRESEGRVRRRFFACREDKRKIGRRESQQKAVLLRRSKLTRGAHSGFCPGIEAGDPAIPLPQFDILAIEVLLGGFDGRAIVSAVEIDTVYDVVVVTNDVHAVIAHLRLPNRRNSHITKTQNR